MAEPRERTKALLAGTRPVCRRCGRRKVWSLHGWVCPNVEQGSMPEPRESMSAAARHARLPYNPFQVDRFVQESNRIEGIDPPPHLHEIQAHERFLAVERVTVVDLEEFVAVVAGNDKVLRRREGQNVRVGPHLPPPGGPDIEAKLRTLLAVANGGADPYAVHVEYETLHPFMDGNGRSGRVLWAWQMLQQGRDPFVLGFLHRWYYDSLDAGRRAS